MSRVIPDKPEPFVYLETSFIKSEFIELHSCDSFDIRMMYPELGMDNAEKGCFVRKEVFERLLKASENLPQGYRFRIWDTWRPFDLQFELFEKYSEKIIKDFGLEDQDSDIQHSVIISFVSRPVSDRNVPPVHTTGGAVDLTIIDPEGNELDMGSGFDEFSDRTYTTYYENNGADSQSEMIRENRRMLYYAMIDAGFTNLPSEWWHYDYGDRFWAFYTEQPAFFKGVFTRGEFNGD